MLAAAERLLFVTIFTKATPGHCLCRFVNFRLSEENTLIRYLRYYFYSIIRANLSWLAIALIIARLAVLISCFQKESMVATATGN